MSLQHTESISEMTQLKDEKNRPVTPRFPPELVRVNPALEQLARLMDNVFVIPGLNLRFGLDALIGLVPGFGDAVSTLVSIYILSEAARRRVPRITLLRMGLNVVVDSVVGSIPLVGDVFDAWWKSNIRNVELLQRSTVTAGANDWSSKRGDWLFVAAIVLVLVGFLALSMTLAWLMVKFLASLASL